MEIELADHSEVRAQVNRIVQSTLMAVDPSMAIMRHLYRDGRRLFLDNDVYDLAGFDNIILISVGKAAIPMALTVQKVLLGVLTKGIVITKYGHSGTASALANDSRITVLESAHPVPDENSLRAGLNVTDMLSALTERTLVIACISGGASALMISPHPGIHLRTLQAINEALLGCGADITEMNAIRSRLEQLKGGGLVRLAAPATVVGLILSDVIGDPLNVIASGLTNHPDARNILIANNTQACEAACQQAQNLGYKSRIVTTQLQGEACERGDEIATAIMSSAPGTCLIYGGEPTVTIHGTGKGGRNQELVLAAAMAFANQPDTPCCITAIGTDGTDGPTDAAGAIAFSNTVSKAFNLGLDAETYLLDNNSYYFHRQLNNLITTGPTGTNVADVVITIRL